MSIDKNLFLVLLPSLNEEKHIAYMISNIRSLGYDLVLSDGGSSDNTLKIALSMNVDVIKRKCKGKGCAVQDGISYAVMNNYDYLVLIDCDGTYPAYEIERLAVFAHEYDMVVGIRDYSKISFNRRIANRLMNFIISILYLTKVEDMASGLRILQIRQFNGLITAKFFDIEPQLLSIALKKKYTIKKVYVSYNERIHGSKTNILTLFPAIIRIIFDRVRKI